MKMLFLAVITLLGIPGSSAGQTASPSTSQTSGASESKGMDKALESRFREYIDALTKKDLATLDKIWAPDYAFINPRGELVTKAQRMENIKTGATEFQSIKPQRERLLVHGNMAVDIGRGTLSGQYGGKESSGEYRYMLVWVKNKDSWQLLANQLTLIAK